MSVQQVVQLAVLLAVQDNPIVDLEAIAEACGADRRDVRQAVTLLFDAEAVEVAPESSQAFGPLTLLLTEAGRERLREALGQ